MRSATKWFENLLATKSAMRRWASLSVMKSATRM
jgi:hypothetical protein